MRNLSALSVDPRTGHILALSAQSRLLLELERVGRRTENVPTFGFLVAGTLRWLSPRFHPESEGNTEQALAYLARSPAAQAAATLH